MPRCFVCGRTADEEDLARDGDRLLCREHYEHERRAAQSRGYSMPAFDDAPGGDEDGEDA